MADNQTYDNHTLYLITRNATKDQVKGSIVAAIHTAKENLAPDLNEAFYLNMVCDREGNSQHHAYLWVDDSRLYNLLVGRNLDGSSRRSEEGLLPPPLLKLPDYELTEQQRQQVRARFGDAEAPNCDRDALVVLPAYVSPRRIDALYSAGAPRWVTTSYLRSIFNRYSSDHNVRNITLFGKSYKASYPFVRFMGNKVYVCFNPSTFDAAFALLMMKKVEIDESEFHPNKQNPRRCVLIFSPRNTTKPSPRGSDDEASQ